MRPAPVCARCGHYESVHTRAAGEPGDCLHVDEDGRLSCPCEALELAEAA